MAVKKKSEKVSFTRELEAFDATMLGVGALIGAGIFVLTGIAAGVAGPASILAFALNGMVTLFTALSYAELTSAVSEAGGGYSFVNKAFPPYVAFLTGWLDWFARIVACSLYALGFASYFLEFTNHYVHPLYSLLVTNLGMHFSLVFLTLAGGLFFIGLNVRGAAATAKTENVITLGKILILLVFVFYGLKKIFGFPEVAWENFTPFFPEGFAPVITAMGLTFIAFEGYDIISTMSEEVKDPKRNIPKAILYALSIVIPIYLLILFVSLGALNPEGMKSWQFLGRFKEIAIVKAAEEFMPAFGVGLIIFGGVLSTMSALNATVWAASRVSFSMARDRFLPQRLSSIHLKRRTPYIAVMVSGAIFLFMAFFLPIEVVGAGASLMFLLTFSLVNLSVIALRGKRPDIKRGFKIPLYPLPPILGVLCCLFLAIFQYKFRPVTWYISIGWILVGLLVYFTIFEKKVKESLPQVLDVDKRPEEERAKAGFRILVPLHNPDTVTKLLDFAIPIAKEKKGEIVVMTVTEVPRVLPIHEGLRFIHHKKPLIKAATEYAQTQGVEISSDMRVAHRVEDGILSSAVKEKISLLIMGWKGHTNTRDRIFGEIADYVIRHAPCDLMVLKLAKYPIKKILFPSAGGPNACLAGEYTQTLVQSFDAEATICHVVSKDASDEKRGEASEWMDKTLQSCQFSLPVENKTIESNSIPAGLIREANDYDLVVIGATKENLFRRIVLGEIPEKLARHSKTSVMVVKRYEGKVKGWIKRIFG